MGRLRNQFGWHFRATVAAAGPEAALTATAAAPATQVWISETSESPLSLLARTRR
jgi:hypothetical protein